MDFVYLTLDSATIQILNNSRHGCVQHRRPVQSNYHEEIAVFCKSGSPESNLQSTGWQSKRSNHYATMPRCQFDQNLSFLKLVFKFLQIFANHCKILQIDSNTACQNLNDNSKFLGTYFTKK